LPWTARAMWTSRNWIDADENGAGAVG